MPIPGRSSSQITPNRSEPCLHFFLGQHGERLLKSRCGSILAPLSKKENVLNVVLHNSAGLVRFSIVPCTVTFSLHCAVRYLAPKNGLEAIETQLSRADLNVGVEGN